MYQRINKVLDHPQDNLDYSKKNGTIHKVFQASQSFPSLKKTKETIF